MAVAASREPGAGSGVSTVFEALEWARARLREHVEAPHLEAEVLLAHVLEVERTGLHTWPRVPLAPQHLHALRAIVERRCAGQPVAYLTGMREFWSLPLEVTPDTLIPRPETETLVERVLALVPHDADWALADLGTGCGAIAIALAHERRRCAITATDASEAALAVAHANAGQLAPGRIEFRHGDWCEAFAPDAAFDVIASNPPYVPEGDPHLHTGDVRFEPPAALRGGADGLDAIRRIAGQARAHLRPGGWLVLEHGHDQAPGVQALLAGLGYTAVETYADLGGHGRVTQARFDA